MRLASHSPVRCSSCFLQKPDVPHVDFESAYEGPPIDQSNPRAGHVDWVVICSDCVEAAHSCLPSVRDVAAEKDAQIAALEAEVAEVGAYADRLEEAVGARPVARQPTPKARKARYQPQEA